MTNRPKLRKHDRVPLERDGEESLLALVDPLGICEPIAIDAEFSVVLDLCDGTRTVAQIRQNLQMTRGLAIELGDLQLFFDSLSEQGFLADGLFEAQAAAQLSYIEQNGLTPLQQGVLYPDPSDDASWLSRLLGTNTKRTHDPSTTCGLIVPHHPPQDCPELFDQALRDLPCANLLDAIVILASDVDGEYDKPACWPFATRTAIGALPEASQLLRRVSPIYRATSAQHLRFSRACAFEITSLLLHGIYGEACPPVLWVAIPRVREGGLTAIEAEHLQEFLSNLQGACAHDQVLWVASAELRHLGSGYGNTDLTTESRNSLFERDRQALQALVAGKMTNALRLMSDYQGGAIRASGATALMALMHLLPLGSKSTWSSYMPKKIDEKRNDWAGLAAARFSSN